MKHYLIHISYVTILVLSIIEIFVGGLPYHTTDETLRKFFERFGEIEEAVVCVLMFVLKSSLIYFTAVRFHRLLLIVKRASRVAMDL